MRIIALIAAITVGILVWAGVATATGSAPWSNQRLTYEVKKLKRQVVTLRLQWRDTDNNQQATAEHYSQLFVKLLDCIELPDGQENACLNASFPGVVR